MTGLDIIYFNPIIDLILTKILKEYVGDPNLFQSYYRSDFNYDHIVQHTSLLHFNPIIGLILTFFKTLKKDSSKLKFQSHYRSDFNIHSYNLKYKLQNFNPIIDLILTNIKKFLNIF